MPPLSTTSFRDIWPDSFFLKRKWFQPVLSPCGTPFFGSHCFFQGRRSHFLMAKVTFSPDSLRRGHSTESTYFPLTSGYCDFLVCVICWKALPIVPHFHRFNVTSLILPAPDWTKGWHLDHKLPSFDLLFRLFFVASGSLTRRRLPMIDIHPIG